MAKPLPDPKDETLIGLTPTDAERVGDVVRHVERASRGGAEGRGKWPGGRGRTLLIYTRSGLTGRVGSTLGSGEVDLYEIDDDGNLVDLGTTETAYNISATAIPGSKHGVATAVGGRLVVTSLEC